MFNECVVITLLSSVDGTVKLHTCTCTLYKAYTCTVYQTINLKGKSSLCTNSIQISPNNFYLKKAMVKLAITLQNTQIENTQCIILVLSNNDFRGNPLYKIPSRIQTD